MCPTASGNDKNPKTEFLNTQEKNFEKSADNDAPVKQPKKNSKKCGLKLKKHQNQAPRRRKGHKGHDNYLEGTQCRQGHNSRQAYGPLRPPATGGPRVCGSQLVKDVKLRETGAFLVYVWLA